MDGILAINSGSSSIKYQAIVLPGGARPVRGVLEGIGSPQARLTHVGADRAPLVRAVEAPDHAAGLDRVFALLADPAYTGRLRLRAVGHRIVHGGGAFSGPVLLDAAAIAELDALRTLAPLHNAANLAGVHAARAHLPETPQVAVFDTAFHHDLPETARLYALPLDLQRRLQSRRYGFHGLSHQAALLAAASRLGRPAETLRLVTLHLGNGASACAIRHGKSVDTSMGYTALEGLVMGSRCGDLDPALPGLIADAGNLTHAQLSDLLNRQSGLLGLCGDNDMRRIEARMAEGDADARRAFDLFCHRVRQYVGAYFAVLNGVDALVFTGGIGEHSAAVRAAVCAELDALGLAVDPARNAAPGEGVRVISPSNAGRKVLIVPADEEGMIARATYDCLNGAPP